MPRPRFNPAQFAVEEPATPLEQIQQSAPAPAAEMVLQGKRPPPEPEIDAGEASAQMLEQAKDNEIAFALAENERDPNKSAEVLAKAQQSFEAGDGGASLTTSEKLILGAMALAPVLGGLLGKDGGALAGAAAAGKGLEKYGEVKLKEDEIFGKQASEKAKIKASHDSENRKMIKQLRDDFSRNRIKVEYDKVSANAAKLNAILSSGKTGTADVAAVMTFLKGLDPASVASPGEQASMREAQTVQDRITAFIEKFSSGQSLGPEAKAEMRSIVNQTESIYRRALDKEIGRIREGAEILGVTPDLIVPANYTAMLVGSGKGSGKTSQKNEPAPQEKTPDTTASGGFNGLINSVKTAITPDKNTVKATGIGEKKKELKSGDTINVPGLGRLIKGPDGKMRLAPQ